MRKARASISSPTHRKAAATSATDKACPSAIGTHGQPHDAFVVPMHAERDGEQPAHAGIEAVKGPKSRQREPRPDLGHGINLV